MSIKHDSIYIHNARQFSNLVAAFDLDSTLVKTKSGKTFPIDEHDWKLFNNNVTPILHQLLESGYSLVIISNQLGLTKNKTTIDVLNKKLDEISKSLDIQSITSFLASEDDTYRKPRIGIWEYIQSRQTIDVSKSFYCGDAAGRSKDFSDTDYKFALNCGLSFITPDDLFANSTFNFKFPSYPLTFENPIVRETKKAAIPNITEKKCLVILVGPPASGKSTIAEQLNMTIVNQDTIGTVSKCKKATKEAMARGENIVIDNTNRNTKIREVWIQIARSNEYSVVVFNLMVDKPLSLHLNTYRALYGSKKKIPAIAIHIFYKQYEAPDLSEGIDKIYNIPFECKSDCQYLNQYL